MELQGSTGMGWQVSMPHLLSFAKTKPGEVLSFLEKHWEDMLVVGANEDGANYSKGRYLQNFFTAEEMKDWSDTEKLICFEWNLRRLGSGNVYTIGDPDLTLAEPRLEDLVSLPSARVETTQGKTEEEKDGNDTATNENIPTTLEGYTLFFATYAFTTTTIDMMETRMTSGGYVKSGKRSVVSQEEALPMGVSTWLEVMRPSIMNEVPDLRMEAVWVGTYMDENAMRKGMGIPDGFKVEFLRYKEQRSGVLSRMTGVVGKIGKRVFKIFT